MRYLLFFKPYDVLPDFTDPDGGDRPTLAQYVCPARRPNPPAGWIATARG